MAIGPGKYDDLCTYVREKAEGDAALVIILNGKKGSGFSCQGHPDDLAALSNVLEALLQNIRADMQKDLKAVIGSDEGRRQ